MNGGIDNLDILNFDAPKGYWERIRQRERELIADMKQLDPIFVSDSRLNYLTERIAEYKTRIDTANLEWDSDIKHKTPLMERLCKWYLADVDKWKRRLKKAVLEMVMRLRGEEWGNLSIEEIELARQADIRDFADSRNGMINCINPAHQDDKPSMSISRGFANCFACGWHGNVIDFVMTKYNIDFVKAVRMLNGK